MVIPRGLIKWQTKKERSPSKFLCLELSAGSHGEGVIQVIDAYDSGLDIYKVMKGVQGGPSARGIGYVSSVPPQDNPV